MLAVVVAVAVVVVVELVFDAADVDADPSTSTKPCRTGPPTGATGMLLRTLSTALPSLSCSVNGRKVGRFCSELGHETFFCPGIGLPLSMSLALLSLSLSPFRAQAPFPLQLGRSKSIDAPLQLSIEAHLSTASASVSSVLVLVLVRPRLGPCTLGVRPTVSNGLSVLTRSSSGPCSYPSLSQLAKNHTLTRATCHQPTNEEARALTQHNSILQIPSHSHTFVDTAHRNGRHNRCARRSSITASTVRPGQLQSRGKQTRAPRAIGAPLRSKDPTKGPTNRIFRSGAWPVRSVFHLTCAWPTCPASSHRFSATYIRMSIA